MITIVYIGDLLAPGGADKLHKPHRHFTRAASSHAEEIWLQPMTERVGVSPRVSVPVESKIIQLLQRLNAIN
jgi:hypothetical protein